VNVATWQVLPVNYFSSRLRNRRFQHSATSMITIVIIHLPPDFFQLCDWHIRRRLVWLLCTARFIYKLRFINFIKSTRLLLSSTRQRWTDMFRPYSTQRNYQSVHCRLSVHLLSFISNRIFSVAIYVYRVCQADVPRLLIQIISARYNVVDYSKHVGREVWRPRTIVLYLNFRNV
jgi:hypothetical protein